MDSGNGQESEQVRVLRVDVDRLKEMVDRRDNDANKSRSNWGLVAKMMSATVAVLTALVLVAYWLLNQQIASAETRMKLQVAENVPTMIDTKLLTAGLATSEQVSVIAQHMSDVDRQLLDLNQKADELLKRRR